MKGIRYAEGMKIYPILGPANITSTATATQYVDFSQVQWATFVVNFGAATSDSTDITTITVQCSTATTSNATETTVGFQYRVSAAVATDTMGAITASSDTACVVTAEDDNKVVVIDVDPSAVAALGASYRYVRLILTPNAEMASNTVGAVAYLEHRFPGNSIPTSS